MNELLQDRIPPQNIEAEQAVIGSIFLDADAIVEAMEYVDAKDFYRRNHQIIFQAMLTLNNKNEAIDVVTIKDCLEKENLLEDSGGLSYLSDLALAVPTAANVAYYAKIVEQKSLLRKLIQSATTIVTNSYDQSQDVETILADAEKNILEVSEKRNHSGFLPISDVLNTAIATIDQLYQNNEEITGLPTGYQALDKMTAGLQPEELIILAARPSVGKTAFALNIAQNVGTKTDCSVAIFSLEMSAESLVNRMLCSEGSIEANHLRTGQLSEEEWQNLIIAMGSLSRANIYIDDTPGIKITEIRAKCRKLAQEKGNLGLILIDYLQLIEGTGRENRQQEVSEISRQLKKLAKELKVPVLALSQLSRGVEQRQDKRPVLSDIRESGSIEQDADIVAFLYREDYYDRNDEEENENDSPKADNIVEVIIEKNRSGARGTVELLFIKEYNKFSSLSLRTGF
ncbi:replicative DNA helicase [Melissococcus plutonius]|uniref:Replicative DNA helicase n=1 Tax=Melissococcus plutonius (strain ATCC 35311 / DSM 29964 / CIP 104052 / LMG 20360 / NCIMB 702443) TaxID=940190 RepID=F3Y7N4_MELPT|nr:replicative DNA helicase [Melissococcus plutonius]AIM24322.1 replicative DNA helicase DnaC [Melissococcus plutonius S1]KMT25679.1 replicative DNA helicase DnaC [Melissococcus plutonius]KMT27023.1 replicative DNA helicase DnaC [Melissococcus plutonius]KMT28399.1 replicative DNA helicase DnaC [Melissococcus plutonius]KMT30449.1 replicative DNA helicase DnaC [Melissococcus plutonius]